MSTLEKALEKEAYDLEHPSPRNHPNNAHPSTATHDKVLDLVDHKTRERNAAKSQERIESMRDSVKNILQNLGEDTEREGLLQTPMRMAKALMFFTQGYEQSLTGIIFYY